MTLRFLELRIPPPLVGLLVGTGMWAAARFAPLFALPRAARLGVAITLASLGVSTALAGVLSFRRARTTVNPLRPETSASLVSSGVFAWTRNPMYLGMLLVLLGWAAYLASAWALLGPVLFAVYITKFQIVPEERVLERLFGAPFAEYRKRVRRWL